MQLIQKVKDYINHHQLLTDGEKIVVGVSGGADSMALLSILRTLGYDCIAAHCNFHLRGDESNRDEDFVEGYCKYKQIEYTSISFDTYKYMADNSISLEMAARELRYNWFNKLSQLCETCKIAVAHHQDDSIETILINLTRGCGIRGLTGIPPKNGLIVRPLLGLFRNEIIEYLTDEKIPFVNDSTNSEDIYTRNKIRLNIIPQLESINPSVKQAVYRMSEYLSDVEAVYLSHIEGVKNDVFDGRIIDIKKLKKQIRPKNILFELLHSYGFNSVIIDNIYSSVNGLSGKIFYSPTHRLIKDRETFILEPLCNEYEETYTIDKDIQLVEEPLSLSVRVQKKEQDWIPEKKNHVLSVDLSKVTFPLKIRRWKQGDRFIPFGMDGSRKLSDYFSDKKYSLSDKENIWLLCSDDEKIIWIIGERADNRFRVTEKTTDILIIEVNNPLS